ncbi:MAG: AAA family ATPase [Pseudomonadota bacterium]
MLKERERALESIKAAAEEVAISGGQAVLVQGEAGIGKTTLIQNVLQTLPTNYISANAMCDPLYTPRPLGPVRDLVKLLSLDQKPKLDEHQMFDGFLHYLQSSPVSIVLIIEDLHWVDQSTLDWLKYIGRRISEAPVLLIGSFRSDEVDAKHPLHSALNTFPRGRKKNLILNPLSVAAVTDMAVGSELSGAHVHEITGGNPFFVTEILNAKGDKSDLPDSLADAINERLNLLSPPELRFVETVACCPVRIPYVTVRKMDLGDVPTLCDAAIARHFLVPDGPNFRFRHELTRRAAYARMPPAAKREAHALFLEALIEDGAPEDQIDLVLHHAQGAHRRDLVLRYAPQAAKTAAALGGHREAAQYLGAVMQDLEGLEPRFAAKICENWAYEAGLALAIDEDVIAARERAVKLWHDVGDAEREGENLRWLSRLHWYRGESEIAKRYIHQAIDLLEKDDATAARAKAYGLRAQFHMLQDQMEDAQIWGQRAYDLAALGEDHEIVAHSLNTIGTARMFRGDRAGEIQLRESLSLSLDEGLHEQAARVYTNLSECLVEFRALDAAADLLDEGIAFDTAHDLDSWTYYLVGRKAQLSFERDLYDEALAIADDVLKRDNQTLLMRMPAMIIQARAKIRLGHDDAAVCLQKAVDAAEKINEPQYVVSIRIAQLEAAVLAHDTEAVIAGMDTLSSDSLSPRKRGEFLFWAQLLGRRPEWHIDDDLPDGFRLALKYHWNEAAMAFEQEQSNYLKAWALGHADEAQEADALFTQIGAMAARKALRLKGLSGLAPLPRGPYRATRQHPYGLTKKEQVVIGLITDGKSNAQIADHLSRSQRTIENHVSSILGKLRCKNRLEVVLRVQSEGWILATAAAS